MATIRRPAEWEKQSEIILAWPSAANDAYYDDKQGLAGVTKDITSIISSVAAFEPVTLLVTPERLKEAEKTFKHSRHVTILPVPDYPKLDIWMRDMAPTFVFNSSQIQAVDYNFNGWGGKYPTGPNSLARIIAHHQTVPFIVSSLVTEGGSLECDGQGTLLITESSILNPNRNPDKDKKTVEAELHRTLGIEKIIWIPGRSGLDITDGHIDGLVRFIAPAKVLLSRPANYEDKSDTWVRAFQEAYDVLASSTDAKGRRLEVVEIQEADLDEIKVDRETRKDIDRGKEDYPSLTYVNYLLVNDGVIFPQFGDRKADKAALKIIEKVYPDREIERVYVDELPFFGGGIHCSTQEIPALDSNS